MGGEPSDGFEHPQGSLETKSAAAGGATRAAAARPMNRLVPGSEQALAFENGESRTDRAGLPWSVTRPSAPLPSASGR
jgi:hypothetical protein